MDAFMRRFDAVMLRVFAFPRPVVAAIGGHAVAGGAILALACDARVMGAGAGRFGLNEVRLGVPFPGLGARDRPLRRSRRRRWSAFSGRGSCSSRGMPWPAAS